MNCPFCNSSKVRRSRVRASDLLHVLFLRVPVRCRNCQERGYVQLSQARGLEASSNSRRERKKMRRHGQATLQRP